jgi:hypothetical protein
MFEQFDKNENDESIKKTAGVEFENLKKSMTQAQGKSHKGQFFDWNAGDAVLTLGTVAAQFLMRQGRYFIRFGALPSYAQSVDQPEPDTWELTPDSQEGKFIWMVGPEPNPPQQLADAIAVRVSQFYDGYEEAAGL